MTVTAIFASNLVSNFRQEYEYRLGLYQAQPAMVQHFLDQQAQLIAHAILDNAPLIRFSLPDGVFPFGEATAFEIPDGRREQVAVRWFVPGSRDLRSVILHQFLSLERSLDPALSLCGSLMRFVVAHSMIHQLLPDGRPVRYRLLEGDEIPSQPLETGPQPKSAIMAGTDAVVHDPDRKDGLGILQVPYPPAALRFFLPHWVAFDEKDGLLTGSLAEAEAHIRSMQSYLRVLHHAVAIDPCMVADETYQRKRTGILGQLVNQGRALGRYEAHEMIKRIKQRASQGSLDRGLSLSLSYFDDQKLTMEMYNLQVIPAGRIMFVPAFIVVAVRNEYARISQDTRLNSSTRKHLIALLALLENAFLYQKGI